MSSTAGPAIGPSDRTTFFEEQARNRRRASRFAVVAAITVALTGIPVSILVTPALFLIGLTVAHLIQLATPLSPGFWALVDQTGRLLPVVLTEIGRAVNAKSLAPIDWAPLIRFGIVLVVPGMLLMLLLWMWVRLVFARAGTGGVLLRIGARLPRDQDLEEKQLVNLVEEMAIAAGVTPPRVMLLDEAAVNAAVVGYAIDDCNLVVTRGLLRSLDRNETQGVIAHLIGSVGNGDLKILSLLFSVFQTFGLLGILLRSFGSRGARAKLGRTFTGLFRRGDGAEIERVADLLAANDDANEPQAKGGCLTVLLMPLAFAGAAVHLLTSIGAWLFFGPPLTAMWRARRFVADATAVQLTRNPDGIAHALQRLGESEIEFSRGAPSRILFVHWPSYSGGGDLSQSGRFHPSLAKRISRLQASGARLLQLRAGRDHGRMAWWLRPLVWLLWTIVAAASVLAVVTSIAMGALIAAMSLGIMGVALFAIQAFFANLPAIVHFVRTDLPEIGKALWRVAEQLFKAARR